MAITTTLLNVSTTRDAVSVPQLAQGNLVLNDTDTVRSNGEVTDTTIFTLATSTTEPLTATIRRTINAKAKTVYYSIKVSTYKISIDADGIVVHSAPVEAGQWVLRPLTDYDITDANIEALLGNVYALWFASVDGSDVPTTTLLNKLRLGLTNIY